MRERGRKSTTLPSANSATLGLDGGMWAKWPRARAVASLSWPANTVASRAGLTLCCSASRTPGRAMAAAQPQIELITRRPDPLSATQRSTASVVSSSSAPSAVSSARIGATICGSYMASRVGRRPAIAQGPPPHWAAPAHRIRCVAP